MTDHSIYCPTKTTANCAEGEYYDDSVTGFGSRVFPPVIVDDVQHAFEVINQLGAQGAFSAQGAQGEIGPQGEVGPQGSGAQGGTWTPTISNLGGVSGTPTTSGQFTQTGNIVQSTIRVSGLQTNGTQGIKTIQSTVPVKNNGNFGNAFEATGVCIFDFNGIDFEDAVGVVQSVASNERVILRINQATAGPTGLDVIQATFMYED